ncbi:hypothetical protein RN001_006392 [Aquatica leii]|uniref:Protein inturned n=1 Tax=Aquatica leii TaxID=1421715 RepID=A0AAN7PE13_9COLE|nr:hypothetical protein RN001_006392 [Aquatica leii]
MQRIKTPSHPPDDWSDSNSSSYSDSDSSVPEWESSVNSLGELLFIECDPVVSYSGNRLEPEPSEFSSRNEVRQSTRSKFLKILRRRDSKRRSRRLLKNPESVTVSQETTKVTFQDNEEGEIREVTLKVNQEKYSSGIKSVLIESLLGIIVSTLSDGNRVMIAGFIPESEAAKQKNIKIGDWLKSINNVDLTFNNLNSILEQFVLEVEVVLKLQCVAGVDVTKNPPINELTSQSNFVQELINENSDDENTVSAMLCEHPVGVMYINTECLNETGPEFEGVQYCYPHPYKKNWLCLARGIFITLDHLLQEVTHSSLHLTSAFCDEKLCHIAYKRLKNKLFLLMLPDNCCSIKEMPLIRNELIRLLEFMYQTADSSFGTDVFKLQLDHFFSRFFVRMLSGAWHKMEQKVELANLISKSEIPFYHFEGVLPVSHYLPLPEEARLQIDDALTELEASDYREWNEDPLDCQRLFTIIGSALYHSGFLLSSHFAHEDLVDVHIFCRQHGLFHLSQTEPVRSLVLWREVFPSSCNRGLESESKFVPEGRRYLLIVGTGKDLLIVIMEAGGCTEDPEDHMGPDPFYVEEVQATLAHLQDIGISSLASRWMSNHFDSQVTVPEIPIRRKMDFLSNISFVKSNLPNSQKEVGVQNQKKPEITSILKRRSSDHGPLFSSSLVSLTDDNVDIQSEDSSSQGGYSDRGDFIDEPVLGRRAIREKRHMELYDDESDIEDYRDGSQSNSSYDLSEIRQSLLIDMVEKKPNRLTSGTDNVLFHYVHLDTTEGILLSPPDVQTNSVTLEVVLNNFRKCAQNIHDLFQNTLRYKEMLAQDVTKCVFNKSLIAIKEYGTLFECTFADDLFKKYDKLTYWVIGRVYNIPHHKEVFVCYQDTIPQNIIEISFKLGAMAN